MPMCNYYALSIKAKLDQNYEIAHSSIPTDGIVREFMNIKYLNIAGYKFVNLAKESLLSLKEQLTEQTQKLAIKGTILLSTEGINLYVAGTAETIHLFTTFLGKIPEFTGLWFKRSESTDIPYKRMFVRIKKEIISLHRPEIQPEKQTAPYLEPKELRQWYAQNKDMVILDTRNTYELNVGTFAQAINLNIENFTDFPQAAAALPEEMKEKPIVTFCTGGIRCEKASAYLINLGFKNVWQLNGGILNYFEQCGGDYFNGNCFVFDERGAIDPNLQEVVNE